MSGDRNTDYLTQAVQENSPLQNLMAPRPYSPAETKEVADDANARAAAAAVVAKEKLAQEALMADPAEMRKLFPQVLKDVSLNHNGHLDRAEIEKGLQNKSLPEEEQTFLKVLQSGYDNFRWTPSFTSATLGHFDLDKDGVSAESLAMLDKAVDRKIPEDPYFSEAQTPTAIGSFIVNGLLGAAMSKYIYNDDPKEVAIWAAVGAIGGAAWNEGRLYYQRSDGTEDKLYDQVKTGYQSFVSDYKKGKVEKPVSVE